MTTRQSHRPPGKGAKTGQPTPADSPRAESVRGGTSQSPRLVVGIGASAGGLDACQRFLSGAPVGADIAFVIVLHLSPSEESHIAAILQRGTRLAVTQVRSGERVEADHVYVIAPGTSLTLLDGVFAAAAQAEPHYGARPIDAFFSSLATERGESAVGIVLSGTGSDGAAGLENIGAAGGLCLVQAPESAEYDGMPRNALATGAVEAEDAPEALGPIVLRYSETPRVRPDRGNLVSLRTDATREGIAAVLAPLGKRYRVDFRDYKTGTLERRTERRMELRHISGWQEYLAYMTAHPEEIDELYRDLLIGVTSFFRDAEEWQLLEREIAPSLVEQGAGGGPVRAWSAGCATGEEAYGLAILLLEHLEAAGSRRGLKVFASDASDTALAFARRGVYPASRVESISPERLRRFFRVVPDGFEVERPLRDAVTFAAHDLLSDPPFPNLDLVSCRNVLIYLEPAAQEGLLERFRFALRRGGILWLGVSETVGRRTDIFERLPGKRPLYRAIGISRPGRHHPARRASELDPVHSPEGRRRPGEPAKAPRLLEKLVLHRHVAPSVAVDRAFNILYFFGSTEPYLTQPQGEAKLDLLAWVRPELYATLRAGLAEATDLRRPVTVIASRLMRETATVRVEIVIEPIPASAHGAAHLLVTFRDLPVPPASDLDASAGADVAGPLVAQLRQEIQETRDELRSMVDQLRVASDEHGAGVEELLSLNEEFQSSNEELEASKEELQSLNEELTTINSQLEERNEELRSLSSDLENLLVSAEVATVFLDRELRIRRYTPACQAILRIGPTDVGRPLVEVAMQVRDPALLGDAAHVLMDRAPIEAELATDDGRWFLRRVLPYRGASGSVDGVCLTFHEVTAQKNAASASEYARLYAEAIIQTSRTPLLVLDAEYRLVSANAAFYTTFQVDEGETAGRRLDELGNGQWDIPAVRTLLHATLVGQRGVRDFDVDHMFERIGFRSMRLNADVLLRSGRPDLLLLSIEDVTDLRRAERDGATRVDEMAHDHRRKDEFLAMLGHELRNPLGALASGLEMLRAPAAIAVEPVRGMMERQTRRMAAMLDQLLDVSRVSSGKFELRRDATDLAAAATAAVETTRPQLSAAGHELTVSLPVPGTALVLGDVVRLAQLIENLLGNAAKYTEPGGRIALTLQVVGDKVRLSVRDNGIGLEPAMLERIFELFTQAPTSLHRAKGGLGLGLALVRSLAAMHGGTVAAFSPGLGRGTEVVMTLPRLIMGIPAAATEPAAARRIHPRRILIVDDEIDAAGTLAELLTLKGHSVRVVPDGPGALAIAPAFAPEVALVDIGLPGMDGYELARRLRDTLGTSVLLVAVTGYTNDKARLHNAGFDNHLLKPLDFEKLFCLLAELDTTPAPEPADSAS